MANENIPAGFREVKKNPNIPAGFREVQQSAANQQPQGNEDLFSGILRSFGAGGSLGFRDEAQAGLESLIGLGDFDSNLNRIRKEDNSFADKRPVIDFIAKLAGGGVFAPLTGGGSLGSTIAREGALGAIEGFGSAEDKFSEQGFIDTAVGTAFSAAPSAAFGGARSFTVPSTASRRVSGEIQGAAKRVKELLPDIQVITKGEQYQNPIRKSLEQFSQNLPLAGRSSRGIKENFEQVLKDEVQDIGSPFSATNLTSSKIDAADVLRVTDEIIPTNTSSLTPSESLVSLNEASTKNLYDSLFRGRDFDIPDNSVETILSSIEKANKVIGKSDVVGKAGNDLLDALSATGGKMSGSRYQEIRSQLGSVARKLSKADDTAGARAVSDMKKALDDAIKGQLTDSQQGLLNTANSTFRKKSILSDFNVVDAKTGAVNQKQLAKAIEANPDLGLDLQTGDNLLNDLSTLSKATKPPKDPGFFGVAGTLGLGLGTGGTGFALPPILGAVDFLGNKVGKVPDIPENVLEGGIKLFGTAGRAKD